MARKVQAGGDTAEATEPTVLPTRLLGAPAIEVLRTNPMTEDRSAKALESFPSSPSSTSLDADRRSILETLQRAMRRE